MRTYFVLHTLGLVSCEKVPLLTESEQPLVSLFEERGIQTEVVIWNQSTVNWKTFDCLIIRSVWDYHLKHDAFLSWLDYLESERIFTLNASGVIRRNLHKFYLRELEKKGVEIVPTVFIDRTSDLNLSPIKERGWACAVIKPAVSASAYLTELFAISEIAIIENSFRSISVDTDLLVQKFMTEIRELGELSIIFFNRKYVYTILKTAKHDEFRVQSEYGGSAHLFYPDKSIIETAANILSHFEDDILYARVDGIIKNERFILMEIELIEPHLFFEKMDGARARFVEVAIELINRKTEGR